MKIINKTKNTIISENAKPCRSIWSKGRGLMFSKPKDLLFIEKKEKHVPLHMYFVFHPIDVIYINSKMQVVEIKENFRPFRFYSPKNKAQYVVEVPAGRVKESKTTQMDQLSLQAPQ